MGEDRVACVPVVSRAGPITGSFLGNDMNRFLGIVAALALLAGAARAADLPVKAPPPPVAVADWSGFYIGGDAGFRATQTDYTTTNQTFAGVPAGPFAPGACVALGCVFDQQMRELSGRVGVYGGYNWQVAKSWLLGVEGDWGWADASSTEANCLHPATDCTGRAADTFVVRSTWDGSVRGRAGWLATPTLLLYATGGAAWIHVDATSNCSTSPAGAFCAPGGFSPAVITNSADKVGWTAGGGIEAMISPNLLVRGELRYADYGRIHNSDLRTIGGVPFIVSYDLKTTSSLAKVGIAYKFGGPVVANY